MFKKNTVKNVSGLAGKYIDNEEGRMDIIFEQLY